MPLETATYITDLVSSNPAASDPLAGADDHIRTIKGALKASFPNFTSAPLNLTQAQIEAAVSSTANGISVLNDSGIAFKTNTDDKITNPAHGRIDLTLAGTLAATFLNSSGVLSVSFPGSLTVTKPINGPGITPIGGTIIWLSDVLPNTGGVWCWANGGVLSRTTAGAGLELYQEWSRSGGDPLRYGPGDGSTTFNVINLQEVAPVGKSGMGGGTSPGLLPSIASGLKSALNGLFGSDTTTLAVGQLPAHDHAVFLHDPSHVHFSGSFFTQSGPGVGGGGAFGTNLSANTSPATTGMTIGSVNGVANDNKTAQTGTGAAVPITQPSRAVNFIIRIA